MKKSHYNKIKISLFIAALALFSFVAIYGITSYKYLSKNHTPNAHIREKIKLYAAPFLTNKILDAIKLYSIESATNVSADFISIADLMKISKNQNSEYSCIGFVGYEKMPESFGELATSDVGGTILKAESIVAVTGNQFLLDQVPQENGALFHNFCQLYNEAIVGGIKISISDSSHGEQIKDKIQHRYLSDCGKICSNVGKSIIGIRDVGLADLVEGGTHDYVAVSTHPISVMEASRGVVSMEIEGLFVYAPSSMGDVFSSSEQSLYRLISVAKNKQLKIISYYSEIDVVRSKFEDICRIQTLMQAPLSIDFIAKEELLSSSGIMLGLRADMKNVGSRIYISPKEDSINIVGKCLCDNLKNSLDGKEKCLALLHFIGENLKIAEL